MLAGCGNSHPLAGKYVYSNVYLDDGQNDIPLDGAETGDIYSELVVKGSSEDNLTYVLKLKTEDDADLITFNSGVDTFEEGHITISQVDGNDIYFILEESNLVCLYRGDADDLLIAVSSEDEYFLYMFYQKQ